jgi:hypothetical protein
MNVQAAKVLLGAFWAISRAEAKYYLSFEDTESRAQIQVGAEMTGDQVNASDLQ